ncbi:MFS transporter [Bradyrhizobium sp. SZCCHNS3002]|uniref:MFS transporter n=1 Tax=Bradyrhizobium sp. SZCCHNS3002 TaxID=3057310 RepID=UPI0028E655B5|nr:MFS transporter [Bradyrhizobium sp. SZCCHNS3002]
MTGKAPGMFRSLHKFNYRVWAAGALVSNIGTWMQRTAQTWLVLIQLTSHNASAVGTVMALQYGPQLLLLPLTGYVADHFNQRRVLIATQATMGAFALILGLLTVTGVVQLWQVDVFAFLFGCAAAFDAPVRQTFVAELVGNDDLPNAIALNSTSFNAARMIGPAIAGMVIAAFGTGWAFLINGASFMAVLASLNLLRIADLRPNPRAQHAKGNVLASVTAGFHYAWSHPELRATLIMLALIGTFGLNFQIFVSTMAIKVFHSDARGYGLLSSVMAVGTVAGALFNASRHRPRFGALLAGSGLFGLGCTLAALAPTIWLFGAALVVIGVAALMFTNTTNSLMQLATEPSMRGRVMALRVGVALGGTPIGAPIVGWVADSLGPRWALGVGAASGLAAALVAIAAMRTPHRT